MKTNCLDNGLDTDYDNVYANQTSGVTGNHTTDATVLADLTAISDNGPNTMNFEAVNCHSVAGSTSGGWNTLTPW